MVTMSSAGGTPSIQELLVGVDFPVAKQDLLDHLQENGAADWMLAAIRDAGATRFAAPQEVIAVVRGT
jgi:hypothetical protein